MDVARLEKLARRGDASVEACAHRLRAAIRSSYRTVTAFAEASGQTQQAVSNALGGANYPSHKGMLRLFWADRIDFNFSMVGDVRDLPGDVQLRLYVALEALENEVAQKPD
jgi:hypothetical protein